MTSAFAFEVDEHGKLERADDSKEVIEDALSLDQLFGEDAFYDTLEDVVKAYKKQKGAETH